MIEISSPASEPTSAAEPAGLRPDTFAAIRRGLHGRCPACGKGRLFRRYLKVAESCHSCGLEFHHHRADDFPPYIVMFIVGHVVGYGIYVSETRFDDVPMWFHVAVWPAATLILCLALLQPVKGAVVALQYALGMHGFAAAARPRPAVTREQTEEDGIERRAR